MLQVIAEEDDDFFSLLVRVEKLVQPLTHHKSACIEITHIQNQLSAKLSPKQATNLVEGAHPVWMEDIVYANVHNTDEFVFSLFNENYSLVAFQKMAMNKLFPFLNTGEVINQQLSLVPVEGVTTELSVSFSLFEPKEPMAGLFLLDLSLEPTNSSWKSHQQEEGKGLVGQKQKLLLCLNCDQIESFTELPLLKRGPNRGRQ